MRHSDVICVTHTHIYVVHEQVDGPYNAIYLTIPTVFCREGPGTNYVSEVLRLSKHTQVKQMNLAKQTFIIYDDDHRHKNISKQTQVTCK